MEKILPISIPSVQTYLNHAFPFAILENNEFFRNWLFTNYTQLYTFYNRKNPTSDFKVDFYSYDGKYPKNPFLEYSRLNKDTIIAGNINILDFVIEHINLNYYIEIGIDEYYWSNKKNYMKAHFHHDNLIYGYNLYEKKLYYLGYDRDMIFGEHSVDFSEFIDSFVNNEESNLKFIKNFTSELLSVTTKYVYHDNVNFDMEIFSKYLFDFLESKNSFTSHKGMENSVFGLNIYEDLIDKINNIGKDMRIYRLIWEHKKVMRMRLEYLHSKGILSNENFEFYHNESMNLTEKCLLLRNIGMKYSISDNKKLLSSICSRFQEIKLLEKAMLEKLLLDIS